MTDRTRKSNGPELREHMRARVNDSTPGDSAKASTRLPDKPWKYNPPAPNDVSRPKPVVVPKSK